MTCFLFVVFLDHLVNLFRKIQTFVDVALLRIGGIGANGEVFA